MASNTTRRESTHPGCVCAQSSSCCLLLPAGTASSHSNRRRLQPQIPWRDPSLKTPLSWGRSVPCKALPAPAGVTSLCH